VIKSVLALDHGVLPKTLHVERPTDHVDWSSGAVRLLQQELPWPPTAAGHRRRAAVSAFGMSGTNAHAILEQAPDVPEPAATGAPAGLVACPLSATTDTALRAQAARLLEHLEQHRELGAAEVGWSLATTRAALRRRAVVFAGDRADLLAGLRTVAGGQTAAIPDAAGSSEAIALGTAYCGGEEVDWTKVFEPGLGCVDLPTYAFQHRRFWPEPAPAPVQALPPVPVPTPVQVPPPHTEPSAVADTGPGADELLERILDAASDLLGLPADEIDPDDGFFQLGLDSVLAMRLRAVLEEITGASVSVTVLFDQPTARELAGHLARRCAEQTAPPPPQQSQPPPPESLTEDDLLLLLTTEIEAAQAARTRGGSRP
jgi:acyl transferase domain-containing protein